MTTLAPSLFYRDFDNNGNPLAGGLVYTYSAGTTTPAATYTDVTGGTPNTNPIVLNARGETSIWIPVNTGYKFVVTDSAGNPIRTVDNVYNTQQTNGYGGSDTGSASAYVLTYSAPFTSYANGVTVSFVPANTNTGAATININAIGAVSIVNPDGSALQAGQIVAGQIVNLIYQSGAFRLLLTGTNPLSLPFLTNLNTATTIYDGAASPTAYPIGYRQIPQTIVNGTYSTLLSDDGKHLYHSDGSAYTFTINNALAYPIGATISFVNDASAAVNITIALSTGTLRWSPSGGTGNRTLAQYGKATAQKVAATIWYITGVGLT